MQDWIGRVPSIDWTLAAGLMISALVAMLTRHRGGRFRGLLGWVGFWLLLGAILVAISRLRPWISLTLLGLLMFAELRTFFSLVPVRPRDRYAVLASYVAIPTALLLGANVTQASFLATLSVLLFLLLPVLLSIRASQEGLLESMGRLLLGVLLFVFCASHMGLMVHWPASGLPELFALLVLGAELPQRLAGRFGHESGLLRSTIGLVGGVVLATGFGYWLGPSCGLVEEDSARAGLLVALAVTLGSLLTGAVMRNLELGAAATRVGRGAFLDRAIPAVYAAPVFFHYLVHFA